ncbi:hypothetical protein ACF07V_31200 [Streptomyces sp. NPDC015661]|uniref:hypothetical protein n=1 Tax=Streptomyces sp. NPDC015661 TaxID=3364961 RepID=UPI0036F822E4
MTVSHDQDSLSVRDSRGAVKALDWNAEAAIPRHPDAPTAIATDGDAAEDEDELDVCWDWAGGFLDETTLAASTVECDEEWGRGRHWLVDTTGRNGFVRIDCPSPVPSEPTALGGGVRSTLSGTRDGRGSTMLYAISAHGGRSRGPDVVGTGANPSPLSEGTRQPEHIRTLPPDLARSPDRGRLAGRR